MAEPTDQQTVRDAVSYWASFLEFSQRYLRIPGVQAAVYADGAVAWTGCYGLADLAAGTPLTDGHLFRIASHSKTFAATALLQLAEAGKVRLDDTVGTHVPELAGLPAGAVTLRELLSHAAGVVRDSANGDFWQLDGEFPDRTQLIALLGEPSAVVLPANERFKYSNIGYGLLGLVIENASGLSFADYVHTEIAGRLGLPDLAGEYEPDRAADYAVGYTSRSYADLRVPIEHVDTRALAAATGCHATARDLVQYFAAHLPGDERLISDSSKRQAQQPLWPMKLGAPEARYGLGFSIDKIGERDVFGHGGGYPGHITRTLVDPASRIVVSVFTNASDGAAEQLALALFKLLDLATGATPDGSAPGVDRNRFTGRYANLLGHQEDLALLGGRLYLLNPSAPDPAAEPVELEVMDERTLRQAGRHGGHSIGEPMTFEFDVNGDVVSLRGPSGMSMWPLADIHLPDRITVRR